MFTLLTKTSSLSFHHIPPIFPSTFLIATPSINHSRHHTDYTTEPPTLSTIFLTLSHYEHPQVLPVNLSNISIVNNYKHYFFILLH